MDGKTFNINLKNDLSCILIIDYNANNSSVIKFIDNLTDESIIDPENIQKIHDIPNLNYQIDSKDFDYIISPKLIDVNFYHDYKYLNIDYIKFNLNKLDEIQNYPDNAFIKKIYDSVRCAAHFVNYKGETIDNSEFVEYHHSFSFNQIDNKNVIFSIKEQIQEYINHNYPNKDTLVKVVLLEKDNYYYDENCINVNIVEKTLLNNDRDYQFQQDIQQELEKLTNKLMINKLQRKL